MNFRILFLLPLFSTFAHAGVCESLKTDSPNLYQRFCAESTEVSKPGGSNSTFSGSFNVNTATLPTEPSSYGVETLVSKLRSGPGWNLTYSLIKGFHRFGTGISTGGTNTFFGDDVMQRQTRGAELKTFNPIENEIGHITNLNLGTSFEVMKFSSESSFKIAGSLRYNKTTNTWGGGPAFLFSFEHLTFGAGFTEEKVSNQLSRTVFKTFMVGARLSVFELEYDVLINNADSRLRPIQVLTLTTSLGPITLIAAVRTLNYLVAGDVTQTHYGFQWLISKQISIGALYNYLPGANTLGFQYYL